jgi:hypothetical protein
VTVVHHDLQWLLPGRALEQALHRLEEPGPLETRVAQRLDGGHTEVVEQRREGGQALDESGACATRAATHEGPKDVDEHAIVEVSLEWRHGRGEHPESSDGSHGSSLLGSRDFPAPGSPESTTAWA